jgi:hypothetical protein
VLENHGYLMTEIALRKHPAGLVAEPRPEPDVPHEAWLDEERAERALSDSHKTRMFFRPRVNP